MKVPKAFCLSSPNLVLKAWKIPRELLVFSPLLKTEESGFYCQQEMVAVAVVTARTQVPARHKSHPASPWTILYLGCLRKTNWGRASPLRQSVLRMTSQTNPEAWSVACPVYAVLGNQTQSIVHARQALNQLSHIHSPVVWVLAWMTVSVSDFCSLGSPFQDLTGTKCPGCKSDRMLCNSPTPSVTSLPVEEDPDSLGPWFPFLCHACEKNYTPCSSTMLCKLTDNSLGFRKTWLIGQVPSGFKTLFKVLFVCFVSFNFCQNPPSLTW